MLAEAMNHVMAAKEILDTMLGYLGFVVRIEVDTAGPEPGLLVFTEEGNFLIGNDGDRLDDIQYLVNRLLQRQDEAAPRIRVDINHFRSMSEDRLIEEAERLAQRVIHTGRPAKMEPMNSYFRRLIHNHFLNHPRVQTWSPTDQARLKRVTIQPRKTGAAPEAE